MTEKEFSDLSALEKMTTGYPITKEPFVPEILKQAVDWKVLTSVNDIPKVGFTFGPEGSQLVEPESLESMRKRLLGRYKNNPKISKVFEEPLPQNLIAISFSEINFKVAQAQKSCQEFLLSDEFEIPKDAYFTYQKLSESVQATYYNENGIEFLAGICYYPVPTGEEMYLKSDSAVIYMSRLSAEPYPLQDRLKSYNKVTFKRYGRYCKESGKRVLVNCSSAKKPIRHQFYDHYENIYAFSSCVECLEDSLTYKFVEPKPEYPSEVTRSPFVPEILAHQVGLKTIKNIPGDSIVGFTLAAEGSELANANCLKMIHDYLKLRLPLASNQLEESLPINTIAISMSQANFHIGKNCQGFVPVELFDIPEDAYYSYQRLSENVQATYYNENGIEFLAGVCYYPPVEGKSTNIGKDQGAISFAHISSESYPLQDRNKNLLVLDNKMYGRYCRTAGRRVAIDCSGKHGIVRHLEYNYATKSYDYNTCEECLEDYFTYKWEEPESIKSEPSAVTSEPFVPEILKQAIEWKTNDTTNQIPKLGFTLAAEGLKLVEEESLQMVRDFLSGWFQNYPKILEDFKNPLAENTISISFSHNNFIVGNSCQDFLPIDTIVVPDDAFYTYQKLSENVQATYYNVNGLEFLAGICYYPTKIGKAKLLATDRQAIVIAMKSAEPFPLQDRRKSNIMVKYKKYGRYCNTAGKRVLVDCSGKHGTIRHIEYDHATHYDYIPCEECLEDYFTYKWEEPKNEEPAAVTKEPFEPTILEKAVDRKLIENAKGVQKISYTLAAEGSSLVKDESLEMIRKYLLGLFSKSPKLLEKHETLLPKNVIAVSWAQRNFKIGKSCHEFELVDKFNKPENAYFTYQKLSENVQATYYNENGVEFLAGVCYYPTPIGKTKFLATDRIVIIRAHRSVEPFPLQDRNKSYNMVNYKKYGRYCKTTGKRVVVDCSGKYGTIRHLEYDYARKVYMVSPCEECLEDYFTYKWEEPESIKKTPASLEVSESSETTEKSKVPSTPMSPEVPVNSPTASEGTTDSSESLEAYTEKLLAEMDKMEVTTVFDEEFDAEIVN